uniref:Uncharacterized protein n=1 Tax=Anopheles atroparvus TaxID=41427 RepID=A0A182JEI0_ANOAO
MYVCICDHPVNWYGTERSKSFSQQVVFGAFVRRCVWKPERLYVVINCKLNKRRLTYTSRCSMASRSVTVLTVHGRRLNVKVEPNLTILEILETVCRKYNFSPEEYDLTHHNRVLDLSTMFRFSGLPNNALLEMAKTKRARTEDDVIILLQLEDGTRPSGTFKPSDTLMQVLETLCPERTPGDAYLLMVYMRREVYWDAMGTTSLKSLGLCNGRAILRLLQRKPEAVNTQANVSAPLPSTKGAHPSIGNTESNKVGLGSTEENPPADNAPQTEDMRQLQTQAASHQTAPEADLSLPLAESPTDDAAKKAKTDTTPTSTDPPQATVRKLERFSASAQIVFIGERQALLYHASSAEREVSEVDDSFFELSVPEVLQMQKHLQERVKALEDAPLVTSSLRELEKHQTMLSSMTRYRQAVIRVQFPDRYVLQGDFQMHETVSHIEEFVRSFLADPTTPFYLYTTPPKVVLDSQAKLLEVNCFPLALLHFGSRHHPDHPGPGEDGATTSPSGPVCVLRPELLGKLSNATGAAVVSARAKRSTANVAAPNTDDDPEDGASVGGNTISDESLGAGPSNRIPNRNFRQSTATNQITSEREAKILKFLKK